MISSFTLGVRKNIQVILELFYKLSKIASYSLRLVKCEFWLHSIAFLAHIVSSKGIRVDLQKIEAVKQWPRPTSALDIRSFLGVVGYYRRFVEGSLSVASPLTRLT